MSLSQAKAMPKRRFEEDLAIVDALTFVVIIAVYVTSSPWVRAPFGLPFLTFFPGYVLTAALFPLKRPLSGTERTALSFGVSIVVVALIGIGLSYSQWHVTVHSILLSVSIFIWIVSGVAWYLRGKVGSEERYRFSMSASLRAVRSDWMSSSRRVRGSLVAIVLGVAVSGGVLGYHLANVDDSGKAFTEFYILGKNGTTSDYPRGLSAGEEGAVVIGIANHEDREIEYRFEVTSDGERLLELTLIVLKNGATWEKTVTFSLKKVGAGQVVDFTLCRNDVPTCERRHLRIDISE